MWQVLNEESDITFSAKVVPAACKYVFFIDRIQERRKIVM